MQIALPPAPTPVAPEPVARPGVARTARREEFDGFVAREYPGLLAEVTVLVGDRPRAAGRLRRSLTSTWKDWDRVREDPSPVERVRDGVLARLDLDHNGRTARRRSVPAPVNQPVTMTALAELPVVQRQALVLHHVLGRSVDQVAADTGAPTPTVRRRLCHGAWALASRHPQVRAIPLPQAAPRPRPGARTRVMTDALEDWAATELEVLRETLRFEIAAESGTTTGVGLRHDVLRRRVVTGTVVALGAAGLLGVVGASVQGLTETPGTPPPAPTAPASAPSYAPSYAPKFSTAAVPPAAVLPAAVPPAAVPPAAVPPAARIVPPEPVAPRPPTPRPPMPRPEPPRSPGPPLR